jgi:N-methylhydantoinase A
MTAAHDRADGSTSRWRVGIDTGGTFADLVARPPGDDLVRTMKLPRDAGPERIAEAVVGLGATGPALIVHGTTHVTNAVLEGTFSRTALVTTRGFADVLRIGRQARDDLYDLTRPARVAPIVPPELTFELDERCGPDGVVRRPLDPAQLDELVAWVDQTGPGAVAVCLMHAYANPEHERMVGAALGDRIAVSLSHDVAAEAREFERAAATALNAALQVQTRAYLGALSSALARALPQSELFIVHSAGGMLPTETVADLPLATVMSGPAAGVAAVSRLVRRRSVARAVAFDMGGTSTDVALLVDGSPHVARERRVGGHVVRVPAIAVESIAVGGGSIVGVDDVGALTVGPRSAGAVPGPAAYGRGGEAPTITDASLVAGSIGAGGNAPGLELRRDLAERAVARTADRLGIGVDDLAWRAIEVAHVLMARALSAVVTRRGHDLRECELVAYGGGGPVHAGQLAARTGIPRVIVPALAPVFSALGCCLAEVGIEGVQTRRARLTPEALPELASVADALVAREASRLGIARDGEVRATRRLELRYARQNAELSVDWPTDAGVPELVAAFQAAHRREYGFAPDDPIDVTAVSCRLDVAGGDEWPSGARDGADRTESTASLLLPGGERRDVPVLAVEALRSGATLAGPALLAASFGSITVWLGQEASMDEEGNVVLVSA